VDLYPAIDLLGARVVQLRQGDYDRATDYGGDPAAVAATFVEQGARWIHVVDLDAARTGQPRNRGAVEAIVRAAPGARVEVGGGVRDASDAEALLGAGVARVVLGTAAVADPPLVGRLAARHAGGVAVGLDARDGEVAVRGWTAGSGASVLDLVARFAGDGVGAFVVTDIGRDGTLSGPDIRGLVSVLAATDVPVVASGGVGSLDDLRALADLEAGGRGLAGAIVGTAIHDGRFSVADALAVLAAP
jgi:phosphoribosylformimino-5-aminoimidazole carboxamide ribotide isomerase